VLTQWAEAILKPPRPPLPPPPPDRRLASAPGTQAVITFNPVQDNSEEKPRPIRVRPEEQACKLVRRVEPVIPGDPISESRLRFVVVIGPDGLISHDVMISGNCWLEPFGHHALQQWLYEPTVLDGNAVEVVTEVRLNVRN